MNTRSTLLTCTVCGFRAREAWAPLKKTLCPACAGLHGAALPHGYVFVWLPEMPQSFACALSRTAIAVKHLVDRDEVRWATTEAVAPDEPPGTVPLDFDLGFGAAAAPPLHIDAADIRRPHGDDGFDDDPAFAEEAFRRGGPAAAPKPAKPRTPDWAPTRDPFKDRQPHPLGQGADAVLRALYRRATHLKLSLGCAAEDIHGRIAGLSPEQALAVKAGLRAIPFGAETPAVDAWLENGGTFSGFTLEAAVKSGNANV